MSDDPLISAMDEEIAKGPNSDAPEQTLGGISWLKDFISGKDPTREGLNEAAANGLSAVTKAKLDLAQKIKSGQSLTSSQTVGLGVLALGLLAAGGAIKGKRGMAMGANAFMGGGSMAMKQIENEQEAQQKENLAKASSLDKQESDITKVALENKLAPIKEEESIGARLKLKRQMVKEGLEVPGGNSVKIDMPDVEARKRLEGAQEAIRTIDKVENLLAKNFPLQLKNGETWLEAAARQGTGKISSEGAQKELDSSLQSILRANAKSLGANPSNQDVERLQAEITGGGVYSVPFLAKRLASMKDDAQGRAEIILKTGRTLAEGGGYKTDPEKFTGRSVGNKEASTASDGKSSPGETLMFLVNGKPMWLTKEEYTRRNAAGDSILKVGS